MQGMRLITVLVIGLGAIGWGRSESPGASRGEEAYRSKIQPLLEKYCYDCHSDGTEKGDFALDQHANYAAMRADLAAWDNVRQQIATHVMPPEKKEQPSLMERDEIVAWIDDSVFWMDPEKPDPGHVVYRRLNRAEYNNTVRDTFLIDLRPAKEFPPDDSGYGFDNIADVLSLSPILMEKYMRAAIQISEEATRVRDSDHSHVVVKPDQFWNQKGSARAEGGARWFGSEGESAAKLNVPLAGGYAVTVKASAQHAGDEPARLRLRIGDVELGTMDVTSTFEEEKTVWQHLKKEVQLKAGTTKVVVSFENDFYDEGNPDPKRRDRNLAIAEISVDGPYGLTAPRGSRFLQWLLDGKPVGPPSLALTGEDFWKGEGTSNIDTGAIELASSGYVRHPLEIEKEAEHVFRIKAGALQAGNEPAKFELRIGGKTLGAFDVTAKDQAEQWFECRGRLPAGRHEVQIWFLKDFWDEKTRADRNLWVHEFTVHHAAKSDILSRADLPPLISKMGARVFRRPLSDDEKNRWTSLALADMDEGGTVLESVRLTLEAMLISPSFLFRGGAQPAGVPSHGSVAIDEFSLASRLSYFLWSAPPDERLLDLAGKQELRKNLAAEIRRMIGDWRAEALTENFAGQWLQLRDMEIVEPNQKQYPEFKGGMAYDMKKETQLFFSHILKENRPVSEFLNADYTFLNASLAKFYRLPPPAGDDRNKFEKVALRGTPRGGLLTQGSILTLTSNPTRTSPVKRGKFILENILGTPPPPAPGGVPPLDERKVASERLTLREQFEAHRSNASCAGCHAFLDPIGFALENFDAVGQWRDNEKGKPVDVAGKLVRGQSFASFEEFRSLLTRDLAGDFERNLTEHLLTYALGRGLQHHDKPAVREILSRVRPSGIPIQDLIIAICESAPFQRLRVP